jgi:hypothetical protein
VIGQRSGVEFFTNLYVADVGNYKIRKIAIATDVVSRLTGVVDMANAADVADGADAAALTLL